MLKSGYVCSDSPVRDRFGWERIYLYVLHSCFFTACMHLAIVSEEREIGSVIK